MMKSHAHAWSLAALLGFVPPADALAQAGSPPPDQPFTTDSAARACLDRAIASRVAEARRTFPSARRRLEDGLPPGHQFFVTMRLRDSAGRFEQAFIAVDSARGDSLYGRVASQIGFVRGYRYGQPHRLAVDTILDWLIGRPDGTEEGNVVGNYLDTLQARIRAGAIPKPC